MPFKIYLASLLFLLLATPVFSQKTTVHGQLLDASNDDPLAYANVQFHGENGGTTTDINGFFLLESTSKNVRKIRASYIGFTTQLVDIQPGTRSELVVKMQPGAANISEITVRPERYRRKNNPAVDLIAEVFAHKDLNRMGGLDFYEFRAYEKLEFDLNNITDKFRRKWWLRRFQWVFNEVDTNRVTGKIALPFYFRERISRVVYRRSPAAEKEYVEAEKQTTLDDFSDDEGMSASLNALYSPVDIYDGKISLLTTEFMGPLSSLAPTFYHFYITDTVDFQGVKCANVFFAPAFKGDLAFMGNLLVALDSTFAVRRVEMGISKQINLNFVSDLRIEQEFSFVGEGQNRRLMLSKDDVKMEFSILKKADGRTVIGKKSVRYSDIRAGEILPDSLFRPIQKQLELDSSRLRTEAFWLKNRPSPLPDREQRIYNLIDSIPKNPTFKRVLLVSRLAFSAYHKIGKFEIGPMNSTYSFNDVEGSRWRIGGRTTDKFSKNWQLETYTAWGLRDQRMKYFLAATRSFGKHQPRRFPMFQWSVSYQNDIQTSGQEFQFLRNDNLLNSFQRGTSDRAIYNRAWKSNFQREFLSGFSFALLFERSEKTSAGSLFFDFTEPATGEMRTKKRLVNTSFGWSLRFAPNEKIRQGARNRNSIQNKYPVFLLNFRQSVRGFLGGEFPYAVGSVGVEKQLFVAPFGKSMFSAAAGRVFGGGVPYPLLQLPNSNQTFFYRRTAWNLMNNLEFVSDKYASVNFFHDFNGFIFNKIPLVKAAKWRELVHFHALWGGLDAANQPSATNGLLRFPTDADGRTLTRSLGSKPYLEAAVGVGNIFKIMEVLYVRRLNYRGLPGVDSWGLRLSAGFSF